MRRLFAAASVVVFGLAAVALSTTPLQAATLKIAMVLWRGETPAEQGFKDGLKKLGYQAEYTVINAEQNRTLLRSKLEKSLLPHLESFDYVYSFGTTASKMTKILVRDKVPQLFNIVTDPVKAGIVHSMDQPGGNVSGVSQVVPLSAQIQAAMKLFAVKKLGIMFNPREKNAMIQREQLKQLAQKVGFSVVDLRSPPALEMLQRNLQSLADKSIAVDAVYLPFDSFLISNAKLIGAKLREAKVKSIGATKSFITAGVLVGVVLNYHRLGEAVAGILDRHQKGEKMGAIPVQQVYRTEAPTLVLNATTRAALGLDVPDVLLSEAVIVK